MPDAPLDAAVVRRILKTAPRPRAMSPDYDSAAPTPAEVEEFFGPDGRVMFDSDLIPQQR
jgi:hypothetical protein